MPKKPAAVTRWPDFFKIFHLHTLTGRTRYKAIPININEKILNEDLKKNIGIKKYTAESYLEVIHANYSVGYATPSFLEVFKEHKII